MLTVGNLSLRLSGIGVCAAPNSGVHASRRYNYGTMTDTTYTITLAPALWRYPAGSGDTLLLAAEAAGIALPSSCRNGTCRTCLCRLDTGSVRYLVEWPGLSADEKRDGYVLPCVAAPLSDLVLRTAGTARARLKTVSVLPC
jgi:ferredoxin